MGAWGTGNFANDSALDFLSDLGSEEDGLDLIEDALEYALEAEDQVYIGAGGYSQALAAAEIVAALGGAPAESLPEDASEWVWYRRPADPERLQSLAQLAQKAANRIAEDSELRELWLDTDSADEWLGVVRELAERLGEVPVEGMEAPSDDEKFPQEWAVETALDLEQAVARSHAMLVEYVVADPDDDVLYLPSTYPMVALDTRTGQQRWQSWDAARPLMLLGDVLLAQARPAGLPFKHLHLVLLDRETGELIESFKPRFDEMLVTDFTDTDNLFEVDTRLIDGKLYITWATGIYPPIGASMEDFENMERTGGALCLETADPEQEQVQEQAQKLRIIDPDEIPPEESDTPSDLPEPGEVAQVDEATRLRGPWSLGEEVVVITGPAPAPKRTPEARPGRRRRRRRRPRGASSPIVAQRWDARTGERLDDVTLLERAGPDVAAGLSTDQAYVWIREEDPTASSPCRYHVFDTSSFSQVVCVGANQALGELETRMGDILLFIKGRNLRAADVDTGQVLWEHELR